MGLRAYRFTVQFSNFTDKPKPKSTEKLQLKLILLKVVKLPYIWLKTIPLEVLLSFKIEIILNLEVRFIFFITYLLLTSVRFKKYE